jgi:glycosyltransferase involved in cell wall biosynthesis
MTERLAIVIPALNEARAIGQVIEAIDKRCAGLPYELVVVDDGSTDGTAEVAERFGARTIRHRHNRGYGAAIKTGIRSVDTDFVLTMDADGQHRAEDVVRLWRARGDSDMVIGQRSSLIHSALWRMPGKWVLGWMARRLTGRRIPDLNSGLRLVRRDVALKYLHLCPEGFSLSTTLTMALLSRRYEVRAVPIEVARRAGKSTVSLSTGLDTLILILRIATLFNPLRLFLPASALAATFGILWGVPYALAGDGVSVGSMLALVTSVLLFALGLISDQISQSRLERFE